MDTSEKMIYLIKPIDWQEEFSLRIPVCPYCKEPAYEKGKCCFCGKAYIWIDDKE